MEKRPATLLGNAPKDVQDVLVPMIGTFYEGRQEIQRDEAMRSVGFAAQTLMLAARAMGYDSCPMIGFDAQKVAELIHLPADHAIGMILTIGKAAKPANPKGGYLPMHDILFENSFTS
jgi:nitroreductase